MSEGDTSANYAVFHFLEPFSFQHDAHNKSQESHKYTRIAATCYQWSNRGRQNIDKFLDRKLKRKSLLWRPWNG